MHTRTAISKLQAILLIDIIIVSSAAAGYYYISSLPGPNLSPAQIQLMGLQVNPTNALVGQTVTVLVNVTNVGGEKGTYVANLTLDGVQNQAQAIALSPGETKTVNFTISGADEGTHLVAIGTLAGTFTLTSKFAVSNLAINRTEANIGEPIGITVKVTNKAQESGNYSVTLSINDSQIQTKSVQLDAGASANVLFAIVEQKEGTYQIQIGALNGTFTINPAAPPPKPAEFQVTNLTITPSVTDSGKPANVTAEVTNVGQVNGNYSANFLVNGEMQGSKTIELSGGETQTVTFTVTETATGNYSISIGNSTGTLIVQEPSTITLTSLIVRPYEVWAGQTVQIIANGTNQGTQTSSLSVDLSIGTSSDNLETVETKTFTLASGATSAVVFNYTAQPLPGGDSLTYLVDVNGMQGGFMVVKTGYHTLNVGILPQGDAQFTVTFPDGHKEQHTTFWSALLPDGTYTVTMPNQDPTGRITFLQWDDGSTSLSRTITLNSRMTLTATYTGGTSCPSLYTWNGTQYAYISEISNHGWLGYINYLTGNPNWPIVYYKNNPWDYIPITSNELTPTNGYLNVTLQQRWNEIFYLDSAQLVVVDHPANVSVYSTMVEQYLDPNYMGNIYTVSNNLLSPISAVNQNGENVLPQISKMDGIFTNGTNGIQSPAWNNITWNRITLNFGDLSNASTIKLVVRAIVDWGSGQDYTNWLNEFFAQPVPNGTQVTPPPYMQVKAANGSWVLVPQGREFPLPPDGVARTYVVDLTGLWNGLFPTNDHDYQLRISNFWNVTFDYLGIDTTPQQNITIQTINPQAYLYQAFSPGSAAGEGNFTKYGNVTALVLHPDDMFVIGRQGDAVSLQFPISNLPPPAPGMVRTYFLNESCWFKDENGNWGFNASFTVEPLPFQNMTGFPYPPNENYPNDTAHQNYLQQWNTRIIPETVASQNTPTQSSFATPALMVVAIVMVVIALELPRTMIKAYHSKRQKRS